MTRQRRRQLELVIARVAEAAYRRGFQQGHDTAARGQALELDVDTWRFAVPLHRAPSPHGYRETTAADRLRIEEPTLGRLLDDLVDDDAHRRHIAGGNPVRRTVMNAATKSTLDTDYERLTTCLRHGMHAGGDDLAYDLQDLLLDAVTAVRASYTGTGGGRAETNIDAVAVALADVATAILSRVARPPLRPQERIAGDTMPPGRYWVGDLCYVLHDAWQVVPFEDGIHTLPDGRRIAKFNTIHGDGVYVDDQGREYMVDSGSLGCILAADIRDTDANYAPDGGEYVEVGRPFTPRRVYPAGSSPNVDGGVLELAGVRIDLDDAGEE